MSIESAKFIVQRGADQFKCQGDQLRDKLENEDQLAVQHDYDNECSRWKYRKVIRDINECWTYKDISEEQGLNGSDPNATYVLYRDVCIDRATDTAYYLDGENLFKSTDNETWTLLSQDAPWQSELLGLDESIKLSANNGVIYVAINARVFETVDEGQNWTMPLPTVQTAINYWREGGVRFGTENGKPFAYWHTGKRYSSSSYRLYRRFDETGTWEEKTIKEKYIGFVEWSDEAQVFFILNDEQYNSEILKITWSDTYPTLVATINTVDVNGYRAFTVTKSEIWCTAFSISESKNLNKAYNFDGSIKYENFPAGNAAHSDWGNHILYDRTIDDILFGSVKFSNNSVSSAQGGRYKLCEWYSGEFPMKDDGNFVDHGTAGFMYYWPKIGRYLQAVQSKGLGTSPVFEYCSESIYKKTISIESNNIDEIDDTDWLCCTDDDGVTYKVRGSEFKKLFEMP